MSACLDRLSLLCHLQGCYQCYAFESYRQFSSSGLLLSFPGSSSPISRRPYSHSTRIDLLTFSRHPLSRSSFRIDSSCSPLARSPFHLSYWEPITHDICLVKISLSSQIPSSIRVPSAAEKRLNRSSRLSPTQSPATALSPSCPR